MLARLNRFHGHGTVRRVYRTGRPFRTGPLSMHVQTGERVKTTKVAVVVSRKIHKSAVKRNRIRRRVYEALRHHLDSFKQPAEIVITIYQPELATDPSDKI